MKQTAQKEGLTPRELVQGCACCGYVVRMDEREKRLIEQLCFDIPECWWERWRDTLEASVATDDGQQIARR